MGGMSLKEKAVLAILAVIALYALAVGLWFMRQEGEWKNAAKTYQKACETYRAECRLIGEKSKWVDDYEEERSHMPSFADGQLTDTTWMQRMDEIADTNNVFISSRQSLAEVQAGEVYELPIEVKSWEGALESLVHFMHQLENSDDGMFDLKSINLRPSNKKGYFKGSFVLTCAYMREN